MINCKKCLLEFEPTPYDLRKRYQQCQSCRRENAKNWRAKRKASGNPVLSSKMTSEYHVAYRKTYYKEDRNRLRRNALKKLQRCRPDVRIKEQARRKVHNAIRTGSMKRLPCEACGNKQTDAHHDDYSKPLEVRWLCRSHHSEFHNKAKCAQAEGKSR